MRPIVWLLLAALTLGIAWPAGAQEAGEAVRVIANTQEYIEATNTIVASGNVRVTYGDIVLTADRVSANLTTQEVAAEGNVTVVQGARVVRGDRANYNLETRMGEVLHASTVVGQIIGSGERIESFPDRIELYQASVTTCNQPRPDYRLSARRLILYPGRQLRAQGVSLYLFEHRLFTLPSLHRNLAGTGGNSIIIPRIGRSTAYGFYLLGDSPINLGGGTQGLLQLRLSQRHAISGGVRLDQLFGSRFFLWMIVKEEVRGRKAVDVLEDQLPYLGIALGPRQIGGPGGVTVSSQLSAGYFRERPTDVNTWRGAATAQIAWRTIPLGRNLRLGLLADLLGATYSTGDAYGFLKPEISLNVERPYGFRGGVTFIDYLDAGTSPLLYDRADVPRELRPRLAYNQPGWEISSLWRFDLTHNSLFDTELSYLRRFHCLSAGISYGFRRHEVGVDLMIQGLGPVSPRPLGTQAPGTR